MGRKFWMILTSEYTPLYCHSHSGSNICPFSFIHSWIADSSVSVKVVSDWRILSQKKIDRHILSQKKIDKTHFVSEEKLNTGIYSEKNWIIIFRINLTQSVNLNGLSRSANGSQACPLNICTPSRRSTSISLTCNFINSTTQQHYSTNAVQLNTFGGQISKWINPMIKTQS